MLLALIVLGSGNSLHSMPSGPLTKGLHLRQPVSPMGRPPSPVFGETEADTFKARLVRGKEQLVAKSTG